MKGKGMKKGKEERRKEEGRKRILTLVIER